ncbi:MAG: hypothetical protein JSV33_10230 [bacterium]|nr:MAG: hypothetical protein JSV33_10230 [bacterium]
MRLARIVIVTLVALVVGWGSVSANPFQDRGLQRATCIIDNHELDTFHEAQEILTRRGAKALQMFPPEAIFGYFPSGVEATELGDLPVTVVRSALDLASADIDPIVSRVLRNLFHEELYYQSATYGDPGPIDDLLLRVPEEIVEQTKVRGPRKGSPSMIQERGINQNSEFLIGKVVVNVIFPESNGGSEDWTEDELASAMSGISLGISQYIQKAHWVNLSFTYEYRKQVPVSYEPIESGDFNVHQVWMGEALSYLGYSHNPFWGAHTLNNDMRRKHNADWAFTAFVVDMSAHYSPQMPPGSPDCWGGSGYVAYAYLGGPLMVVPYPACRYGYELGFGRVFIHEMSHIFWALDEYASAMQGCDAYSGYLNIPNRNTLYMSCQETVPCIMQSGTIPGPPLPICQYTMGQVGLADENENDLPDIYELPPTIDFIVIPGLNMDTIYDGTWVVSARAINDAVPNRNPDQTGDRIDYAAWIISGEYSLNGSPWTELKPSDGKWDSSFESIGFFMRGFTPGMSSVLFRIENCIGLSAEIERDVFYIGMQYFSTWTEDWSSDPFWTEEEPQWVDLHWKTAAEVFGATFDIYRRDLTSGSEEEYMGMVIEPEDIGTLSRHYKFRDETAAAGHIYNYQIIAEFDLTIDGEDKHFRFPSRVIEKKATIPVYGALISHLVPNPTIGTTTFTVDVPVTEDPSSGTRASKQPGVRRAPGLMETTTNVLVTVFNVKGEKVRTIHDLPVYSGLLTLSWEGVNDNHLPVSPGVYFIHVRAGGLEAVRKIVIVQ